MLKGHHLTLMIGPVEAVPAPQSVLDALVGVTVTSASGKPSGFELSFNLSNNSPLHTLFLLAGGAAIPVMRVIVVVTVGGAPEVLMDGVVTNQQVTPSNDAGHSTLTLTGSDLSAVMDLIDFSGVPFPAMPPEARVALMLTKYVFLGVIPGVVPSVLVDTPIPVERIPAQRGTDLAYIKYLAEMVGYTFYVDPGPEPGTSVAYWGPEVKFGPPQPALNINMDAHTNVEHLNFRYDAQAAELPVLFIQNPQTKVPIPIPVPPVTPLNPPLGAVPPIPMKVRPIHETAKYNPVQGALIGMAKASQSADVVSGTGTLDVVRYGRVLRARKLVGVRGAGPAFDGLYYVRSVTHRIKRGEYKQDFELSRNGLISITPKVPV